MRRQLDDEYTESRWNKCKNLQARKKGSCRVVFFTARQPVMRMSSRSLKKPTKVKKHRAAAKAQCRHTRGPNKGKFKAC
jgi:hypothetical protein